MDNQHKKIKGYRDLSQAEIDLMNRIKEHGARTGEMLKELSDLRKTPDGIGELSVDQLKDSYEALDLAKASLQTGQMWFVRAVALPDSF
tara:strand:+ start:8327 stop:8593 length:267 start_codon:yes stop_codon:yes gene_type:complete